MKGVSFIKKLRRVCFTPDRHTAGYLFNNFIRGRPCANADGAGYHWIDNAAAVVRVMGRRVPRTTAAALSRSEEHTSELQSRLHLVCRLLLEKKNTTTVSQLYA